MKKHLLWAAAAMLLAGTANLLAQEPTTLDSRGAFLFVQRPPAEVFATVAKLLNAELVFDSRITRKVSIQLDFHMSLRTLLNTLCESAGCRWRMAGNKLIAEWDGAADAAPRPDPKWEQVADAVNVPVPSMTIENQPLASAVVAVTKAANSGCRVAVTSQYSNRRVTARLANMRLLDALRTLIAAAAGEQRELVVIGYLEPGNPVPTRCTIGIAEK